MPHGGGRGDHVAGHLDEWGKAGHRLHAVAYARLAKAAALLPHEELHKEATLLALAHSVWSQCTFGS